MPAAPKSRWGEKAEAALREQWAAGDSATAIGIALGFSRNAVLGKVHRMKLSMRVEGSGGGPKTGRQRPPGARHPSGDTSADKRIKARAKAELRAKNASFGAIGLPALTPVRQPRLPEPKVVAISRKHARPFDDCPSGHCHWPLWDNVPFSTVPVAERLCCGAEAGVKAIVDGKPLPHVYCDAHRAIACTTVKARPETAEAARSGRSGRSRIGGAA